MRKNSKNKFIVYARNSGGTYLTERAVRIPGANFRWAKDRSIATKLPKEVADKVAYRYGGVVIRA
jgi:hypothetical protein